MDTRYIANLLDLYLNEIALDFLIDSFDKKSVIEITLLTGLYDNEHSINAKLLQKFKIYQQELLKDGINLEMKIVATKEGHDRVAHDRFLLGRNIKFNAISFTLLQRARFSEIKETQNEIPFDEYWNDSDSFDIVKDWNKIEKLTLFDIKCSNCGKDARISIRPDGRRPLYCKDCFKKYRR